MKAIIIDDEKLARQVIEQHLKAFPDIEIITTCADGFEGLKAIQEHQPDLIFLDIQMPRITGFEMLELIDQKPFVIFTTAFDQYAIKAFEVNALDYLLKPFSKERFSAAIQRFYAEHTKKTDTETDLDLGETPESLKRVVVKTGNAIKIIPLSDILYFEAWDDHVKIHTTEGYFAKKKSMQYFESLLSQAGFIRIHRSYLVNSSHVNSIKPYTADTYRIVLRNNTEISASRNGYARLKEKLGL